MTWDAMIWVGGYLTLGVLWSLFNASSNTYRTWEQNAQKAGYEWLIPFVFVVGVFIWPIGFTVTLIWALKRKSQN